MKVAVAIITDEQQRILITQRRLHVPHGGLWEFPGGKLEAQELPEHALIREIREEVGLEVQQYNFLGQINHQYTDRDVELFIFHVTQFSGSATCLEGQLNMSWVHLTEIKPQDFPEANHAIIKLIGNYTKTLL